MRICIYKNLNIENLLKLFGAAKLGELMHKVNSVFEI